MLARVGFVVVLVLVSSAHAAPATRARGEVELFSIVEGLGTDATTRIQQASDNFPRAVLPLDTVRRVQQTLGGIGKQVTGEAIEEETEAGMSLSEFQSAKLWHDAHLMGLNERMAARNRSSALCLNQAQAGDDNRALLGTTIDRCKSQATEAQQVVEREEAFANERAQRSATTLRTLANITALLREQMAAEQLVVDKGTHMDVVSHLVHRMFGKLNASLHLTADLSTRVRVMRERDAEEVKHLVQVIECAECAEALGTMQRLHNSSAQRNRDARDTCNAIADHDYKRTQAETAVYAKEKEEFEVVSERYEQLRVAEHKRHTLSVATAEDVSQLAETILSNPASVQDRSACASDNDQVRLTPHAVHTAWNCGVTCLQQGNDAHCLPACLFPLGLSSTCNVCVRGFAECVGGRCSELCAYGAGCEECALGAVECTAALHECGVATP